MQKIKILHTGDIHMKEKGGDASYKAFSRILELAQLEKVDAILIAGDLFDSTLASVSDKNFIASMFSRIPEIKVFLVAGNHDSLPCYQGVEFPPNVHVFQEGVSKVSLGDIDIYGVSMAANYSEKSLIEGFGVDDPIKVNLLLTHGDLNVSSAYNPFTTAQIASSGVDYVALGHVHMSDGVKKSGNSFYAYCGVPQGRGFDELGEKGVLIGEIHKGHVDLTFFKTSLYEYLEIEIDLTGLSDYAQIAALIQEKTDEKNAYKIHLTGVFAGGFVINTAHIQTMLAQYPALKLLDETGEELDLDAIKQEYTLKGLFVKNLLDAGRDMQAITYGLAALDGKKIDIS